MQEAAPACSPESGQGVGGGLEIEVAQEGSTGESCGQVLGSGPGPPCPWLLDASLWASVSPCGR